jgi:creatinine amidohydrolase/Fe(II)-dependent formamide hydrolase-like protein
LAENGVIGDPARTTTERGARYWEKVLEVALAEVG